MEPIFYNNPAGKPVTHSSYSSRQTFKHCPREFQLTRINGYQDRTKRAATFFGTCIEKGVQAFEESGRQHAAGVAVFETLWKEVKTIPEFNELIYSDVEGDWQNLMVIGREMQRLYEIRANYLPISTNPKTLFQQKLRKQIFPGSELSKLENVSLLDMLTFPHPDHPALVPLPHAEGCPYNRETKIKCTCDAFGDYRSLIVDIKTSAKDLAVQLVKLDPQLAEYAWQARIPDVAFLWFVKSSRGFKRSSRVALLEDSHQYKAGFELYVIEIDDEKDGITPVWLGKRDELEKFEKETKGLRGKALEAAKSNAIHTLMLAENPIIRVMDYQFTKQRIQFGAARLTQQDMDDAGRDAAQVSVEMIRAREEDYYPKLAGIRFPNEKCNFCSMRWICLDLPAERDKNLLRKGEEWLEEKFAQD